MDTWHSNLVRVTNLEKTVIDSLRSVDLMTFIVEEMIKNYIDSSSKDIDKLIKYANEFKVMEIVEEKNLTKV